MASVKKVKGSVRSSLEKKSIKPVKKEMPGLEGVALPDEKEGASDRFADYTILLFGAKKIGKTTLAAMFPECFILLTEPGGKAITAYKKPLTSWVAFKKYIKLLKKDRKFKTVCIDTVDRLFKLCWDHMLEQMGIEHPSDESWGKGWAGIRDEFDAAITDLLSLNKGIIFTSHEAEKEIEIRSGGKYHKLMPSMSNQARESVEALVDIWAHYDYDGDRRTLRIRGNDHIGAGHRLTKHFQTPAGKELKVIDMGTTVEEGYKNLIDAFHNRYTPPAKVSKPKMTIKPSLKKKKAA